MTDRERGICLESGRRSEGGYVLFITTILVTLMALGSYTVLVYANTIWARVSGTTSLGRAASIAEGGLSYTVEQWRKSSTFLAYTDGNGDGVATLNSENAQVGVARTLGGGTFTILEIEDVSLSGVTGKVVTVRGTYDDIRYTYRALLSPNVLSPIQGVGTMGNQEWWGGSQFSSLGGGTGTAFGNGNLSASGNQTIIGNVRVAGTVSANQGAITGSITQLAAPVTFPDQQAIIDGKIDNANNAQPSGYWANPKTSFVVNTAVTAMEVIDASPAKLGSGWSSANTPNMKHLCVKGGKLTFNAGNYAFGRLWLDGSIVTLRSPVGGGRLVLSDLYLTNGARLILDTTNGPFEVISAKNNVFYYGSDVGSTNAQRWNGAAFANGTPSIKLDGSSSNHIWNATAGQGGYVGPKPARGTTIGYDDWIVKDSSVLASVTSSPAAKGFEMFMQEGVDLVLSNGARFMAGVQPADLASLQTSTTTMTQMDAMVQNATGMIVWSGGGYLPRLNINANGSNPGQKSVFTGLTYGAFEATMGPQGNFVGAFVGKTIDTKGTVTYDSNLASLVIAEDPNTQHVVVKFREGT